MRGAQLGGGRFPGRISIVGVSGAGKTTLSLEIARLCPVRWINADTYYWGANWTLSHPRDPNRKFRAALRERGNWIADGSVFHGARELLELPDLVIYLDYSIPRLLLHGFKRWLKHRRHKRPELPSGCEERFPTGFLFEAATRRARRLHEESLRAYPPQRLARIRSPRQLRAFVQSYFTEGVAI